MKTRYAIKWEDGTIIESHKTDVDAANSADRQRMNEDHSRFMQEYKVVPTSNVA